MSDLDTTVEFARVQEIRLGSYSGFNIFVGAVHKTWAGLKGVVVRKEEPK